MSVDIQSRYITHFGENDDPVLSPGLQILKDEHAPLLERMESIIHKIDHLQKDPTLNQAGWNELLLQEKQFAAELERHSMKEETILFPLLKRVLGTAYGPIEIMELEHENIRMNLRTFADKSENLLMSDKQDLTELLLILQKDLEIMQQHFYKEEHAIFPMAEQLLNEDEKEKMIHLFVEKNPVVL